MSQHFYYGVYLPSIKQKIYFKELTICQLKSIIKSILNNDDNALSFCFNSIIKENCRDVLENFELTIIDRLIILLNMRVVSMGSQQKLQITCGETNKPFSYTVDYNELVAQLETANLQGVGIGIHSYITVEYGLPLVRSTAPSMEVSKYNRLLTSIRRIKIGHQEYPISAADYYDLSSIIEKLPNKLSDDILFYLEQEEEKINKIFFVKTVSPYTNNPIEQKLSLDDSDILRILKIAFREDLQALYQSIYYMVHVLRFNPEYVENLTVNEKELYWSFYLADESAKQKAAKETAKSDINIRDATQDFINETRA